MSVPHRKAQHGTGRAHIHTFGGQAHFSELSYTYPLKLLSPDIPSHGEIPTGIAYVLSYGGGLGSTKVFKSRTLSDRHRLASITPSSNTTSQHLTVTLSPSSLFLLLPDPVTPFESASYTQIQTFTLAPTSSLVLLDWFTSGRMARGEEWAFERYYSRNEVFIGGKRVARDVMLLEQASDDKGTHGLPVRRLKDRLAPYACYATLLLVGPQTRDLTASFQSAYNQISQRQRAEPEDLIWSFSPLTDINAGACVRVAGTETELVKDWLKSRMEGLGKIVGQDVYNKAFVSALVPDLLISLFAPRPYFLVFLVAVVMCGRFALRNFYLNRVADEYPDIPPRRWNDEDQFHPRYNVAPQTQVLALMQQPNGQGQQEVIVQTMRWGLQARWSDPSSFSSKNPINARSEVVLEGTAPIWNSVRGDKHCVVICEGYFEWLKRGQNRTPHYIKHPANHLLLLAGFYELVKTTPKPTYTCTILTTEANKELAFLHDRMPVILDGNQAMRWLEAGGGKAWGGVLEELSKPYEGKLVCYEVPNGVGKVGNEDPSFVEPVAERKDGLRAMMSKMAQKPKVEKKPIPSPTKPREPIQVLSDSSDEDVKPKTEGSSPASRRTRSSPVPHRVKPSLTKTKREPPSPSKSAKREASSPVQFELVSSGSDSDDGVVVDESRKRRKVESGSAPCTNRSKKKAPSKKTIEDFFGKKRAL